MNTSESLIDNQRVSDKKKKDGESRKKSSLSGEKKSSESSSRKVSGDGKKQSDSKKSFDSKKFSDSKKSDSKKPSDNKKSSTEGKRSSSESKKSISTSKSKSSDTKLDGKKKSADSKSYDGKKNSSDGKKKKEPIRKKESEIDSPVDSGSEMETVSLTQSEDLKESHDTKKKGRSGRLKPAIGAFDAFNLDQSSETNHNTMTSNAPAPTPRFRARRRNSVGGTSGAPTTVFDNFGENSVISTRSAPITGFELEPASQREARRRARRASAVGHAGAATVANFVSASFHGGSTAVDYGYGGAAVADYGYGDTTPEMYGYEDHTKPIATGSDMFGADFGNFGNGVGGRPVGVRRNSLGGARYEPSKIDTSTDTNANAQYQRKLIDDITGFSTSCEPRSTHIRRGSVTGGGNSFMLPMTDAAPIVDNTAARNDRRPRRRASLGIGAGFSGQNHQVLELDLPETEKRNKNLFFKDRGDKNKSKTNAMRSSAKPTENLTGYDFDRDRRRFMG